MKTKIRQRALMGGVSLLSLALVAPGVALAAPADEAVGQVEEIIVTAQKREERALTVPITISTVTERQMEAAGVASASGLATLVPGLQMNRSINSATPFIRGIGNPAGSAGEEGATAFYIDGVYNPNQFANFFEFNNISRIEVLKGPQGTLFGRNSAAGAILVTTKDPRHDFGLDASVGYGNYDTRTAGFYVTGGLTETLAANLAIQGRDQKDGWGRSLTTGEDNGLSRFFSARAKLLWTPTESTRVTLSGDYYRARDTLVSHPIVRNAFGFNDPGFYNSYTELQPKNDVWNYGGALKIQQSFALFDVVSITARRETKSYDIFDFDTLPTNIVSFKPLTPKDESWQQELRILSPAGSPVTWVAGAFLFHDRAAFAPYHQTGTGTGTPLPGTGEAFFHREVLQITDSWATFAQATFPLDRIWDRTHLTLGARHSVDDRSLRLRQTSNVPAQNLGTRPEVSVRYPKSTFRISVDHQFSDDVMAYASFNTGFKSGLYNLNVPTDPPVRPETVDTYEAGFKAKILDGRAQIESSVFYNQFKDIQLRRVLATGGTQLLNAAEGETYGIDVSFQAVPMENLSLNGGFEVLATEFTRFPNAPATIPRPATCAAGTTGAPTGGNIACVIDATGNDLIQAPQFTANLTATYTISLSSGGSVVLNGAYSYTSSFYWEPDNRLKEPDHSNVNASVAWRLPGDKYQVRVWGQNLTDTKRSSLTASSTTGDQALPSPPRTYGVTLSMKIGE